MSNNAGAEAVFQERRVEFEGSQIVFRRINLGTEASYAEFLKERAKNHIMKWTGQAGPNTQVSALVELAGKAAAGDFRWLGEICLRSFDDDFCCKELLFYWLLQDNANIKKDFAERLFSKQPLLIKELLMEFVFQNPIAASSNDPSAEGAPQ